ncbi:choice-of-anchor J domain-containing protein [Kordia sp.]|uniref:choice-of-anchor J domain-containing protein n=1 Tax=Kordia sp. TaxID=1965332 RepID=UPI003D280395
MKKITLLCITLIAYCWQANAQFTESFETEIPASWTVINNGSTNGWVFDDAPSGGAQDGSAVAGIVYGSNAHDDFLISPAIAVTAGLNDRFSFYIKSRSSTFLESYEVLLSTTDAMASSFTVVLQAETTAAAAWTKIEYFLNSYVGQTVYVAIRATGTDEFELYVDNVVNDTTPSCPEVTALSETITSTTEATINWTAGGSETNWTYEYGVSPYAQGGGGTSGTVMTTPSLDLTGLTEGETYDIYVQANCGGDDSIYVSLTWTQPSLGELCSLPIGLTVEADCSTATPTTLDYSSSFDLGTTDLSCDTFGVNAGSWYEFVAPPTGSVVINLQGETAEYAVFDGCGMQLVCVNTATNQGEVIGLTAGSTYQLAVWKDGAISGTTDICLETIICPNPSTLTASAITTTGATLGWTENGTAASWNVEIVNVTTGGMATGMATNSGVMNPFNATGLTASNEYQFYVQADCGGGDTSDWIGPFAFTTACNPFTPDYDADMSVNVPTCWVEADNGDSSTGPMDLGSSAWAASNHNGTPSNRFNLFISGRSDWIVSPEFDLSMAAPSELKVYVALTEGGTSGSGADLGSDDRVSLLMTTDGGATWSGLQAWVQGNVPTDIGEEITYDLTAQTGTVQFAFLAQEGAVDDPEDIYFHVSKFQVREIPTCVEPTALTATNIMATTADLGWTEAGTATMWDLEIGTSGFTPTGTPTNAGVTTNPYSAMSLTDNTAYDFYVRADCGGANGTSVWAGPFTFSTICGSVTAFPATTDFSSNPATCWAEAGAGEVADGPTGTTSDWKSGRAYTNDDTTVVNSNVINLFQNVDREWLISTVYDIPMGTSYSLDLEVAVTDYSFSGTSDATDTDTMGSDDEVQLLQSVDGGVTWTNITTWNAANQPLVTGTRYIHNITVTGNVQFALWASDGAIDNTEDYDFHVGKFSVLETSTLSTNDISIEGFKYYPNPVKNTLTLKAQKNIQNAVFYNMLGQEVLSVSPNAISKEINTASLKAGTYFVKVTVDNATNTIKIIKQ